MLSSRKIRSMDKTDNQNRQRFIYRGLPVLGMLLCLWYVKEATCDIVYTDYIRLVNTYLPDVLNPRKFFVPDVLTRIPVNYLSRIINVTFFGYSTTFDMALGILGLGLSGLVLGAWCRKQRVGGGWFLFLMFILFGLNKWEMMTNGTGWAHFLAFAGFYSHYLLIDRAAYGQEGRHSRGLLLAMPAVLTLGIAGPYCAVYSVVVFLACGGAWLLGRLEGKKDGRLWITISFVTLLCLLLYVWSNSYAVEDHAGAADVGLAELFAGAPGFFPRFLLKSLASMVVGGETITGWMEQGRIRDSAVYLLGMVVAAGYLAAFWLNIRFNLYRHTLMPLMLLFSGAGSHGIVLISRYIFVNENYGMSSRYALQYQAGLLGIILTFAMTCRALDTKKRLERIAGRVLIAGFCLILLAGHGYTDYVEIKKAPDREAYGKRIEAVAVQFETVDDQVLRETFDYRRSRPDSGAKVRSALTILKENGWNVFGRQ